MKQGSIRLFRLFGITVYLHWAWFILAAYYVQYRTHVYSSATWTLLEFLCLFLIVLIHEFGHQLACRSVGGQTHDIVLWLFGGVAYVSPPQRPGAQLWSIAAGPLVNVILIPVLSILVSLSSHLGWYDTYPDAYDLLHRVWKINIGLLIFNMLPIYPLDGGQILRSLLWFPFGRANSLLATSIIGFIGVGLLMLLALLSFFTAPASAIQLAAITVFILMSCWSGLTHARALVKLANAPHRPGFACPNCKTAPPVGAFWMCGKCRKPFDTFATLGACPNCGTQYTASSCPECGALRPFNEWMVPTTIPPQG
ncbi:MAG TPA: site-2 protease family protein [Candidatus Saccharimonadales bacterium]|nr:site-2 protease family protein [Candidatus Saccharimonadales bacterium]